MIVSVERVYGFVMMPFKILDVHLLFNLTIIRPCVGTDIVMAPSDFLCECSTFSVESRIIPAVADPDHTCNSWSDIKDDLCKASCSFRPSWLCFYTCVAAFNECLCSRWRRMRMIGHTLTVSPSTQPRGPSW